MKVFLLILFSSTQSSYSAGYLWPSSVHKPVSACCFISSSVFVWRVRLLVVEANRMCCSALWGYHLFALSVLCSHGNQYGEEQAQSNTQWPLCFSTCVSLSVCQWMGYVHLSPLVFPPLLHALLTRLTMHSPNFQSSCSPVIFCQSH